MLKKELYDYQEKYGFSIRYAIQDRLSHRLAFISNMFKRTNCGKCIMFRRWRPRPFDNSNSGRPRASAVRKTHTNRFVTTHDSVWWVYNVSAGPLGRGFFVFGELPEPWNRSAGPIGRGFLALGSFLEVVIDSQCRWIVTFCSVVWGRLWGFLELIIDEQGRFDVSIE